MSRITRTIATYTLTEPTKFRTSEEVACWFTEITVQPGTYEYVGTVLPSGEIAERDGSTYHLPFGVDLPGEVTDSYYPALFFGVPVSREPYVPRAGEIGRATTFPIRGAGYSLAHFIIERDLLGKDMSGYDNSNRITLLPDVIPLYTAFVSDVWERQPTEGLWDRGGSVTVNTGRVEAHFSAKLMDADAVTPEMEAAHEGVVDGIQGKAARVLGGNLDFGYRLGYMAGMREYVRKQAERGHTDACKGDGEYDLIDPVAWHPAYFEGYEKGASARRGNVERWVRNGCRGMDTRKRIQDGQPVFAKSPTTGRYGVYRQGTREVLHCGTCRDEAQAALAEALAIELGLEVAAV